MTHQCQYESKATIVVSRIKVYLNSISQILIQWIQQWVKSRHTVASWKLQQLLSSISEKVHSCSVNLARGDPLIDQRTPLVIGTVRVKINTEREELQCIHQHSILNEALWRFLSLCQTRDLMQCMDKLLYSRRRAVVQLRVKSDAEWNFKLYSIYSNCCDDSRIRRAAAEYYRSSSHLHSSNSFETYVHRYCVSVWL